MVTDLSRCRSPFSCLCLPLCFLCFSLPVFLCLAVFLPICLVYLSSFSLPSLFLSFIFFLSLVFHERLPALLRRVNLGAWPGCGTTADCLAHFGLPPSLRRSCGAAAAMQAATTMPPLLETLLFIGVHTPFQVQCSLPGWRRGEAGRLVSKQKTYFCHVLNAPLNPYLLNPPFPPNFSFLVFFSVWCCCSVVVDNLCSNLLTPPSIRCPPLPPPPPPCTPLPLFLFQFVFLALSCSKRLT